MLNTVVMLGMFLNAFVIKQSIVYMHGFSTKKKRSSWQLLPGHWRLSPLLMGSAVQMPVFMVLSGTPRLELHHQERPHESSQVKHKAVRAAVGNHIPSSFFVPSLWMCRGHEIGPQCIQLHFVHENPKGAICYSTVRGWKLLLFECVLHICCI